MIADGANGDGGRDVVVMRRMPGDGAHASPSRPATASCRRSRCRSRRRLQRLEASPKFQELDAATRAKVLEALRESAPKAGGFVAGEPGSKTIVLEIEEED